jgi:uncharacterized membrane protein
MCYTSYMRSFNFEVAPFPAEIPFFFTGPGPAIFIVLGVVAACLSLWTWMDFSHYKTRKDLIIALGLTLAGAGLIVGAVWNVHALASRSGAVDAAYGQTALNVSEWANENYEMHMDGQQAMNLVYNYDLSAESTGLLEYGKTKTLNAEGNVIEVQLVKVNGVYKLLSTDVAEISLPE